MTLSVVLGVALYVGFAATEWAVTASMALAWPLTLLCAVLAICWEDV